MEDAIVIRTVDGVTSFGVLDEETGGVAWVLHVPANSHTRWALQRWLEEDQLWEQSRSETAGRTFPRWAAERDIEDELRDSGAASDVEAVLRVLAARYSSEPYALGYTVQ